MISTNSLSFAFDSYMKENPIDASFYIKIAIALFSMLMAMVMLFGSDWLRIVAATLIIIGGLFLSSLPDFIMLFMLKKVSKSLKK